MTTKEEIDFAVKWIDDHEDDIGFLPANMLAFAKDFIEAQKQVKNCSISDVEGQSEHLCSNLDKNYNCKNMCLTHCIDGNKFWK